MKADSDPVDDDVLMAAVHVTKSSRVVTDYWIIIQGRKFDAEDIYETLSEVKAHSDIYLTDADMAQTLIDIDVLASAGSNRGGYGAKLGSKGDIFLAALKTALREAQADI